MVTYESNVLETERLVSSKQVQRLTGYSRATLWRKSNDRNDPFPQALRSGTHYTRWKLSEVLKWMDSLRDNPQTQS